MLQTRAFLNNLGLTSINGNAIRGTQIIFFFKVN